MCDRERESEREREKASAGERERAPLKQRGAGRSPSRRVSKYDILYEYVIAWLSGWLNTRMPACRVAGIYKYVIAYS